MDIAPKLLVRLFLEAVIFGVTVDFCAIGFSVLHLLCFGIPASEGNLFADKLYRTSLPLIGKLQRPTEKRIRHSAQGVLTVIRDVFLWIYSASGLLFLAFVGTNGVIRWVLPVGILLGFLLSRRSVGRLLRSITNTLATLIRLLLTYAVYILLLPIRKLLCFIHRILQHIIDIFRRYVRQKYLRRYTKKREAELLKRSQYGFRKDQ